MNRLPLRLVSLAVLLAVPLAAATTAAAASAQAPKPGPYYEDAVALGFRIKVPKDWEFVPPHPLDPHTIGKYAPRHVTRMQISAGASVSLNLWLLRFDRRGAEDAPAGDTAGEPVQVSMPVREDVVEWVRSGDLEEGRGWSLDSSEYPRPVKGAKVPGRFWVLEGEATLTAPGAERARIACYAAQFELEPGLSVALVGLGPGEKKWAKFEDAYADMARTLQHVEVAARADAADGAPRSARDKKRAELGAQIATAAGWRLLETENYFLVTNNEDQGFLDELMVRLEAIRAVYVRDYPPEKARRVRSEPPEASRGPDRSSERETPLVEERSAVAPDPLELSRTSVVRVCKDKEQYIQYGNNPTAAGHWDSLAQELVLYDDRQRGGRQNTWATLNHEAFHQYIYYFYGSLSPHSWYNEGTGDYYSGFQYKYKRFTLEKFAWRTGPIREMLNAGRTVPLADFVHWSKTEYYGQNSLGLEGHECYAQGWSFIYFLRTGRENKAKGWNPAWDSILDTYLEVLADTADLDSAVDAAFAGVDWRALERAWKDYSG